MLSNKRGMRVFRKSAIGLLFRKSAIGLLGQKHFRAVTKADPALPAPNFSAEQ
jgi:hypothetical protein